MRRAFVRVLQVSPADHRQRFNWRSADLSDQIPLMVGM
jgi:hypothetical protein